MTEIPSDIFRVRSRWLAA